MNIPNQRTGFLILTLFFACALTTNLVAQGKRPPDPDVEGTPESASAQPPLSQESVPQESAPPVQVQETAPEPVPQETVQPKSTEESQAPAVVEESKPSESAPVQEETAVAETPAAIPAVEAPASEPPPGSQVHTVWIYQETQDCLWMLAKKYYGDPWKWKKIYLANRNAILDPTIIFPKQQIIIPPLEQ